MKKFYSFVFAALAIISAASCQKEMANLVENDSNANSFSFIAGNGDTKTVLNGGTSTWWTPGDKVSVFDNEKKAKEFSTAITEKAASALFTCPSFSIPEDMNLHAIYPAKSDATLNEAGVIGILRVSGTQTAVAGSFDAASAAAYAAGQITNLDTPPALKFNNIHSLVKFTIGGDKAPAKVVLTNGGSRNIAGQFRYNTKATDASPIVQLDDQSQVLPGAKSITLNPAEGESFTIGATYYIAVIGGGNFANVTLTFDETVVKSIEGAKYAAKENNFFVNKIIDLGTVQFPDVTEPVESPLNVERVWGYYSTTTNQWWKDKADGFKGSWFGGDTSLAMDDEYIYIPYGTATAGVYKISLSTGAISNVPVTGISGGTYPTSCARMIKNSDSSINGGKDILLVGNLALSGEPLKFYAYVNGTDADPIVAYNLSAARRFGDKFTVSGTWQSGNIWLRSNQDSPLEAIIPINNGALQTWIDPYRITNEDDNCISEISWYPVSDKTVPDYCLMSTTSEKGVHLMKGCSTAGGATEEAVFPELAKTWGYQFFECDGEKYIACVSLKKGNGNPILQIIKGDGSSLETLKSALSNLNETLVAQFALSNEDNNLSTAGYHATKTLADCAVRVINNEIYIAALGEEAGLSLFKVTAK